MKKTVKALSLISVLFAFTANAEETIKLENEKPILGKWMMYAETAALHKNKKKVQNEWDFKSGGKLAVISRDPRLDAKKKITINYNIENGNVVKQFRPGTSRTETCKVIKLDSKEMTLHCKFNYYLFRKI